jgi:hypothetical protein
MGAANPMNHENDLGGFIIGTDDTQQCVLNRVIDAQSAQGDAARSPLSSRPRQQE